MKIDVLDHGFVRLVSYMQPVPNQEYSYSPDPTANPPEIRTVIGRKPGWTGDLEIVRNARVSYNADWRDTVSEERAKEGWKSLRRDEKLIHYLYQNKHTSPFEAMVFTFEIKCPLFIARQWHRHRTWSYNEVSARYTELPDEFYLPRPDDIGQQAKDNKQMREIPEGLAPKHYAEQIVPMMQATMEQAFVNYRILLKSGVPRELARSVLPLATYTRFFGTVDLHNLFHFIRLRIHPHAQREIREYARALLDLVAPICPVSVDAFRESFPTDERPD